MPDEFYIPAEYLIEKWREDRESGNWGKYLQREREIREKASVS
jgi:hypothetical protein